MDPALQSLLNGHSTSSTATSSVPLSLQMPDEITQLITVFSVIAGFMSLVIVVAYIYNIVLTQKAHKATIETRDILREINERDKARSSDNQQLKINYLAVEDTNTRDSDTSESASDSA